MNIDITIIVTIGAFALSALTFIVGRLMHAKNEGQSAGKIAADIAYIKISIEKLEHKREATAARLEARIDELYRLEREGRKQMTEGRG